MRERIGNFRLLERLGEGGMGVVYAAHDERLGRRVAIKMIRGDADREARDRFWREARAAARINHPNICQLHDVGEDGGDLYIAMELLEGEPLGARLQRGPLDLAEAGTVALGILAALEALHGHEIIHRDLKPSNTFLTPHGVKLLDFGLARLVERTQGETELALTQTGAVFGTPRYMAPEQWRGERVDPRADLFALGAVLFEMLTGNPAFPGRSPDETRHSALFDQPPALSGPPAVAAVDEVIRRALSKKAEERFASATKMREALRDALRQTEGAHVQRVRAVTRIVVLPFRMLRPDPEIDFLSFSLPDAIASSLSGFESLVVRSTLAASKFDAASPDFDRLAREAQVDLVVAGTLLRAGDQLRVSAQLVEAPAGTVLWSQSMQTSMGDIFALQDKLARDIVESLSIPLSSKERGSLQADVPANAKAYEFFLRANQLCFDAATWAVARDLYLQCLEADPNYAPAWAQLGRIYRLLAKYVAHGVDENLERAAEAFRRSLALNPDLSAAHNFRANLEIEMGRSVDSMVHLLDRARAHRTDPAIFVALVFACRYCGLNQASLAAEGLALRIDPNVRTSVGYTHWMRCDFERAVATSADALNFLRPYSLAAAGRTEEAFRLYAQLEGTQSLDVVRALFTSQRAALEGHSDESLAAVRLAAASGFRDPEGLYFLARTVAFVGEPAEALSMFDRIVDGGYYCDQTLARDPWLERLRAAPEFARIVARAEAGRRRASAAYLEHQGDRVLGAAPDP